MLAHPVTQTALSFGLIVALGLLLTLVHDLLEAAAEAHKLRKAWQNALVVEPLRILPTQLKQEPGTSFKIITVRKGHEGDEEEWPKAA